MFWHLIDSDAGHIAAATFAGSAVTALVKREFGWIHMLTQIVIGQLTVAYWIIPTLMAFGVAMAWFITAGFMSGGIGGLLWGAVLSLAVKLQDDPMGTLGWAYKLWKGEKG